MSLGTDIALRWIAARPNCTPETAYALRMEAERTAEGFAQAELDIEAGDESEEMMANSMRARAAQGVPQAEEEPPT